MKLVSDLARLRIDLAQIALALPVEVKEEMGGVAEVGAREARAIAERQGLRKSGDLIRGIEPGVYATSALIRETAQKRGYPYPKVYEFARGLGDFARAIHAPRPFMIPAAQRALEFADLRLRSAIDRLFVRAGWR